MTALALWVSLVLNQPLYITAAPGLTYLYSVDAPDDCDEYDEETQRDLHDETMEGDWQ